MVWREKAKDWSLKREMFAGHGSCANSHHRTTTGHVCSSVAARIICTPVCSVSVLLYLRRRISY